MNTGKEQVQKTRMNKFRVNIKYAQNQRFTMPKH